ILSVITPWVRVVHCPGWIPLSEAVPPDCTEEQVSLSGPSVSGPCRFMAFGAPSLIHGGQSLVYGTCGRREASVLVGKPVGRWSLTKSLSNHLGSRRGCWDPVPRLRQLSLWLAL